MAKSNSFNMLAATLIITGTIFFLENFDILDGIMLFWPIIPTIFGMGFCILFFNSKKDIMLLGIGAFILLNSIFFFYLNFTIWRNLSFLWPIFIIILGISFFVCFLFSKSNVLIYLSVFLMSAGASFIMIFAISSKLWPISLIFAGISFIIINLFETDKNRRIINARKK